MTSSPFRGLGSGDISRRHAIFSILSLASCTQVPAATDPPGLPAGLADIVPFLTTNSQGETFQSSDAGGGVRGIALRDLSTQLRGGRHIAAVDITEVSGFEYGPAIGLRILGRNVPGRPWLRIDDIAAVMKSLDHAVGVTLIPRNVNDETAGHDAITFPDSLVGSPIMASLLANDYRLKQRIAASLSARLSGVLRGCTPPADVPKESRILFIPGNHKKRIENADSVARCIFENVPMQVVPESELKPGVASDPFLAEVVKRFTADLPSLVQTDPLLSIQDNFVRLSLMGGMIRARPDIRRELGFWFETYNLPELSIPMSLPGINAISLSSTCYGRQAGAQNEMSGVTTQRSVYGGVLIDHGPWLNGDRQPLYSLGRVLDSIGVSIIQRTKSAPRSPLMPQLPPQTDIPQAIVNPRISVPSSSIPTPSPNAPRGR